MKNSRLAMFACVAGAAIVSAGCSYSGLYYGMKEQQVSRCYDSHGSLQEECLDNLDTSYEEYEKSRAEILDRQIEPEDPTDDEKIGGEE